jgi:hypothetical protein
MPHPEESRDVATSPGVVLCKLRGPPHNLESLPIRSFPSFTTFRVATAKQLNVVFFDLVWINNSITFCKILLPTSLELIPDSSKM